MIMDLLFQVDLLLNFFTAYEDENGELVTSRCAIAKSYLSSWFLVDLFSSIPITMIQKYSGMESNLTNIKFIKLSRLPRLYRLLRLMKLIRLYKTNQFIANMMREMNINHITLQTV